MLYFLFKQGEIIIEIFISNLYYRSIIRTFFFYFEIPSTKTKLLYNNIYRDITL